MVVVHAVLELLAVFGGPRRHRRMGDEQEGPARCHVCGDASEQLFPGIGQPGVEEGSGDEVEAASAIWVCRFPGGDVGDGEFGGDSADSAARRARSMAVVERSMPVASHPFSAIQTTSAPSPQPTSRTRPAVISETMATRDSFGFPDQMASSESA